MKELKELRKDYINQIENEANLQIEEIIKTGLKEGKEIINISSISSDYVLAILDEMNFKYKSIEGNTYLYIGEDENNFQNGIDAILKCKNDIKNKIDYKNKVKNIVSVLILIIGILCVYVIPHGIMISLPVVAIIAYLYLSIEKSIERDKVRLKD